MSCDWIGDRLVAFQDDELGRSEHLIVEEHLRECRECRDLEQTLALSTPEPFILVPKEHQLHLQAALATTLDIEFNTPHQRVPPSTSQRWASWLRRDRDMSNGTIIAYGLLLAACVSWGVANWIAVRSISAPSSTTALALHSNTASSSETFSSDQYRPAGYELSESTTEPPEEYWR